MPGWNGQHVSSSAESSMMHDDASAGVRAHRHLRALIAEARGQGTTRLPTVRQMCAACDVSTVTMCKALRVFRDEGVVTVRPGAGVHVRAGSDQSVTPRRAADAPRVHRRWEQVRKEIVADITAGRLPPGSRLPSYKELGQRYGACFTTVRRAVLSLVERNTLVADRGRHRVYQPPSRATRASLAIVARGPKGTWTPRSAEFWRVLEKEARRLNLQLEHCIYDGWAGMKEVHSVNFGTLRELQRRRPVLGFMVWTISMGAGHVVDLLRMLARQSTPIAVVDEEDVLVAEGHERSFGAACRFFPMAVGETAGQVVGRYLLSLGHRRIAYVMPDTRLSWSRRRLAGLCEACEDMGENAVREYGLESAGTVARATAVTTGSAAARELDARLRAVERQFVRPDKRSIEPPYSRPLHHLLSRSVLQQHMEPVFDRMLADSERTAWVGGNDDIALMALDYLTRRGVRLPRARSLVGFDDSPAALTADLSTYNFNVVAVAQAMLEHIVEYRPPRQGAPAPPLEIPGMVIERATSGKRA